MKILIIGKVWPEPHSSAAGKRMKQLIGLLSEYGDITFACANTFTGHEAKQAELGVNYRHIQLNDDSFDDFLREINPDIVVFDRFLTEEQYGWRVLETCPNAIRILNTEDLHFLRKTRQKLAKGTHDVVKDVSITDFDNDDTLRELASIYRCDSTLIISPYEMKLLQKTFQVPGELLFYLPIIAESNQETQMQFEKRKDYLFIGNFLHEPNLDAFRVLRKSIWPAIRRQLPEANLRIVGAYPTQEVRDAHQQEGIIVEGHLDDLYPIYNQVRVALVPLRFGAGVKGKIIEAMEYGVPFVTTSIGQEGLWLENNWDDLVCDDWQQFADTAVQIYQSRERCEQLRQLGLEHLRNRFNRTEWKNEFDIYFKSLVENLNSERQNRFYSKLIQHHSLQSTKYLSKWIMEKNKS